MTDFNRIKKMLNGSTTMPQGTAMGTPSATSGNVHYHDGVPCTHDHSEHVHDENCNHEHAHDNK